MKTHHASVKDIIDGNMESPIPLDVFPNTMGINLCSVDGLSWQKQNDGQLVNISIYFIPSNKFSEE